jgi:diguanylate cyclase (GGDEF)-like protein/PAS domain S-box-containing protein
VLFEQVQVHALKSVAHGACDSALSGKGLVVVPTLRNTVPVTGDRQLLDAVLDAAASLIVVVDAEGRLVRWNRACQSVLGHKPDDLAAPGALLELIPAAERDIAQKAMRALKAGQSPVRAELHCRTRDGDLRLIDWTLTALTGPQGALSHVVGTGMDVTAERSWEEERAAVEEQLRYMADHDPLTGLFNRRRLEEELERHIAHGRRYGMGGALLLLDLDDFKKVNDGFGHRAGDRVLRAVAVVLRHRLRESDIVARYGGDEFAVLMPVGGSAEAAELADLLATAVRRDVTTPAGPLDASVGIALFEESGTPDEILSRADDAMYTDKRAASQRQRHLRPVD